MAMASEADWSELPKELLNLISQRIDNEIDLIRFRSTCSNWRSSSIPNHHRSTLTLDFPEFESPRGIDSINNNNTSFINLSKHSFFLIKLPQQDKTLRPLLFKITQNSSGEIKFYNPLLQRHGSLPSFSDSPVFDFNEFSLIHLVTNFKFPDHKIIKASLGVSYMNPSKVIAITSHEKKPIVLGTFSCPGEQPVVFKYGDENWKVIPQMSAYLGDIRLFKGRSYVVDKTGRTVTVGPDDSTVRLVAESLVGGGDMKFLMESDSDLLLADVYDHWFDDRQLVRIDVYKLNQMEKKWVKLPNLRDRVLFLGSQCSFSASTLDLGVAKGNCAIIMDNIFKILSRVPFGSSFLDLDDGRLLPLYDHPQYSKLFWSPFKSKKRLHQ